MKRGKRGIIRVKAVERGKWEYFGEKGKGKGRRI